jgi:hypothetical protein
MALTTTTTTTVETTTDQQILDWISVGHESRLVFCLALRDIAPYCTIYSSCLLVCEYCMAEMK